MFRTFHKIMLPLSSLAFLGLSLDVLSAERSPELQADLDAVIKRSRRFLVDSDSIVKSQEKNGVTVSKLVGGTLPGGIGLARVGEIEIEAPASEVADLWWQFERRREWDNVNTDDSRVVREEDDETRLAYLLSKPKSILAARDFAFYLCRVSPAYFQLPLNAYAFVQVNDNRHEVPGTNEAIRGDVNSIVTIAPLSPMRTKVKYLVDAHARGWVLNSVGELAADDIPLTIGELKKHFDQESKEEEGMTIDEIARKRAMHKHREEHDLSQAHLPVIVTDPSATLDELRVHADTYKGMLAKMTGEESATLRQHYERSLRAIEARIREMERKR